MTSYNTVTGPVLKWSWWTGYCRGSIIIARSKYICEVGRATRVTCTDHTCRMEMLNDFSGLTAAKFHKYFSEFLGTFSSKIKAVIVRVKKWK